MRYFETHQVVEAPSLHHVLDLARQFDDLWVILVMTHMIEQVIEYVANHLHLLLVL